MSTLADAVFENQRQQDRLERVVYGALREFFDRTNATDKRYDHYDRSAEFFVSPGSELTQEEQDVLWTLGFDRCWLVETEDTDAPGPVSNGVERHYYKAQRERARAEE